MEALHRDIATANTYRMEGIKTSITIAGALIAFTVSFRPTLRNVSSPEMMLISWLLLGAAVFGGLVNLHGWTRFYVSYRDYDYKLLEKLGDAGAHATGKAARKNINRWRLAGAVFQWGGLLIGVVLLAMFSWRNLDNVIVKAP